MASEAEIQATARFVIGFGTEQDETWRDYNLDFAGSIDYAKDGVPSAFRPVGNSGYSLGSLQWDFGQQNALAGPFVDGLEAWLTANPAEPRLASTTKFAKVALGLTGRTLSADPAKGLRQQDVNSLSGFVRSEAGSKWVNENIDVNLIGGDDRKHVVVNGKEYDRSLVAVAREAEATKAYVAHDKRRDQAATDLIRAIGMKTYNQSPNSFRTKLLPFLSVDHSLDELAGWHKGLGTGLDSGVAAATRLSTFWSGWKATNGTVMVDDLQSAMVRGALLNPAAASSGDGAYLLAKQVFEDTATFAGFSAAAAAGKDFVQKRFFAAPSGGIAIHPVTKRMRPGMLILKGRQYVWNAAGAAFLNEAGTWVPFPAAKINLRSL